MRFLLPFMLLTGFWAKAQSLDERMVLDINTNRNTAFDEFNFHLSQSADYVAVATPASLLLVGFIRDDQTLKRRGLESAIAVLGSYGAGYIMKNSIKLERPFITNSLIIPVRRKDGYSMPSGSAAVAFASATSLTHTFPKWYVAVPSFGYAGAVAYARVRSGEHYPSDALVGAVIGTGSVWISHKLMKLINKN
ncbi:phosphatase PAP2 family protein [Jiulongibacter sediminis]|uniref:phosphatase PAP2 family protein n=1 Tax=Jiulongibacter sediminis TaxID=1605367 RepID=UPI0009EAAA21|nr:phosphatase PAP2 family protein [Jiulongibacter sediminis]